ncbi:MAG TPA: Mrp/NBP35 family ATP-binding protein [Chloroflexota bacterium]|jgi:ATP-binding protein involved in chromosome partitioning|nr:Mrp/NBP35 family ATP-binding protein [Chloroflexota bacterium]
MVTETQVLDALRNIIDPDLHKDVVSLGFIKNLTIDGVVVSFDFELTTPACPVKDRFLDQAQQLVGRIPGVERVNCTMTSNVRAAGGGARGPIQLPGVKNVVAVGAGKGGVGKTTCAVGLAVGLRQSGAQVGLLDADIHGPNVPLMMGLSEPPHQHENRIVPGLSHGVKIMSAGYFVQENMPLIWRGPMVGKMIQELLGNVEWGELDYLVVDLPPGTGDAPLTLAQAIPLSGAVVVTQPPDVSLMDATKAIAMFQKLEVPILGIVENMSYFVCPCCGTRTEIFSHGGGKAAAERLRVPFLGEIPLNPSIREGGDTGTPVLVSNPASPEGEAFRQFAQATAARISVLQNLRAQEAVKGPRQFIKFFDS